HLRHDEPRHHRHRGSESERPRVRILAAWTVQYFVNDPPPRTTDGRRQHRRDRMGARRVSDHDAYDSQAREHRLAGTSEHRAAAHVLKLKLSEYGCSRASTATAINDPSLF